MWTKRSFMFLLSILFLLSLSLNVSAARLPIVGGDTDTWGGILNTFLSVSLNESGELRSSTVSTSQIIDGTITDTDISDTTNLTLGERITFTFGEIIDNIIDGWITITGGLNVTENLNVVGNATIEGDLNVTGNITVQGLSLTVNGTEVCLSDGTNCQDTTSLGFFANHTSTKTTGNITSGSLNGYLAANAICNAQYPGTHMCQMHEILNTINANKTLTNFTDTFRVSEGAPGFTANANDCDGWKSEDGSSLGSIWIGNTTNGGSGSLVACNAERAIGCCQ